MGYAIENNKLNIPFFAELPNSRKVLPCVFVADDAFRLRKNMMKPFPTQNLPIDERVFNYRLFRAIEELPRTHLG